VIASFAGWALGVLLLDALLVAEAAAVDDEPVDFPDEPAPDPPQPARVRMRTANAPARSRNDGVFKAIPF
jgi:cell division septation protein DedD